MTMANGQESALLAAMPPGIGDLTFGSQEWVNAAREVLTNAVTQHADALADLGTFTLCEVSHNAPAWLHCGGKLAWWARFDGASVTIEAGELDADECDYKAQADHSLMSIMARITNTGTDPQTVAAAQARIHALARAQIDGGIKEHLGLYTLLGILHDEMAPRTMARFVFMTPEWVANARYILTTRAASEKYRADLRGVNYTFSEQFTHTPKYAFPDGSDGGFWVRCSNGLITVGAGPLPEAMAPADRLTLGMYTPVVPVGRSVNASSSAAEKQELEAYVKAALRFDKESGRRPVEQTSPTGQDMPEGLARVFAPLHDELSMRTSGELPSDYDDSIKAVWAKPTLFDREPGYDASWVLYDQVDIYGNPRK
ncbi:MAG: hypothetical protein QMC26_12365 [Pseudomonadales bacterium]|jgi:hypothetical protein